MPIILAFDIYGTLINTHALIPNMMQLGLSENASKSLSIMWRDKQLEYSFRRSAMNAYVPFSKCTEQALIYSLKHQNILLSEQMISKLLSCYRDLDAFDDTNSLLQLKEKNYQLYAFSNGTEADVRRLLENANLLEVFDDIVSVDDVKTFKPDPRVYQHFMTKALGTKDNTVLVSSNPFDVIGALNADMRAVWLQRDKQAVFDEWGIQPTYKISSLQELRSLTL